MSQLAKLAGKKGVYGILTYLNEKGRARFREINGATNLPSPASLTQALQELHKAGFIDRKVSDIPGKAAISYYFLTQRGGDLLRVIDEMKKLERSVTV